MVVADTSLITGLRPTGTQVHVLVQRIYSVTVWTMDMERRTQWRGSENLLRSPGSGARHSPQHTESVQWVPRVVPVGWRVLTVLRVAVLGIAPLRESGDETRSSVETREEGAKEQATELGTIVYTTSCRCIHRADDAESAPTQTPDRRTRRAGPRAHRSPCSVAWSRSALNSKTNFPAATCRHASLHHRIGTTSGSRPARRRGRMRPARSAITTE